MYFAHGASEKIETATTTVAHKHTDGKSGLENPAVVLPLVSIAALVVMLGTYWLLKRFSSWQFPINKKGL